MGDRSCSAEPSAHGLIVDETSVLGSLPVSSATQTEKRARPFQVLVLTPGVGGMGGISRLMDCVSEELEQRSDQELSMHQISTRGDTKALRPFVYLLAVLRVVFACASGRCDLLHVNLASYGSTYRKLVMLNIAAAMRVPYVIHLHGGEYASFWPSRSPRMKRWIDNRFREAQRVIVLGSVWRDLVTEHVPEARERITVLANAAKRPGHQPTPKPRGGPFTILFVGRLNEAKGVRQMIEALDMLKDHKNWIAVLAGDGEVSETRDAIRKLRLHDRVEVPGWLEPDEVSRLWQRGDAFVLPSFIENLPLSIIESFAHGVPVISTSVGSIPELIDDGRTGLLIPTGDSQALASALRQLIDDPDLHRSLMKAGLQEFEARFEIGGYVSRLTSLWKTDIIHFAKS